jgi:hypothetical protein
MPSLRLTRLLFVLMALLTACSPRAEALPLPSPGSDWTLKLVQTGGFAGVNLGVEVTSQGQLTASDGRTHRTVTQPLAPDALARLGQLYAASRLAQPGTPTRSCADCFNYELEARSGAAALHVQLDDTNLASSGFAELIGYLRELRDTALRSQP